jgi:hypothetical protein
MPSDNTRVNLTLPDDVIAVLDRMGAVTGAGRATIVREWLIEALPAMLELTKAVELASQKNIDAFLVMGNVLRELSSQTGQMHLDIQKTRKAAMRKKKRD